MNKMIFPKFYSILLFTLFIQYAYSDYFHLHRRKDDVFNNVPIWTLNSQGYLDYKGYFGQNHIVCEDLETGAVFMPIHKCQDVEGCNLKYYTGVFGKRVTLKHINNGKRHCRPRSKREITKEENTTGEAEFQNVVVDVQQKQGVYAYVDRKSGPRERKERPIRTRRPRIARSVSDVNWDSFTIKILVVVDFALYNKLEQDFEYISQYMNIFWSAVDLKFRLIDKPNIHLKVTGIVIAKENNSLHYIDDNPFYEDDKSTLDIDIALDHFDEIKSYMNDSRIITPDYNIVVTLTGLTAIHDYDDCFGIAFREGICSSNDNAAILTDDGAYFGINNAVHELGHLLGLKHDGDEDDHREGNASIEYYKCKDKAVGLHSVMHPRNPGNFDEFEWSACSMEFFHKIQHYESMRCIAQ